MRDIAPSRFYRYNASGFRRGATMVLVVILLPALFALAAFAINVAHMESLNTELQIATDAAVRAAGRAYADTGDKNIALAAAQTAASKNKIGNYVLPITAADLDFGESLRTSASTPYQFNNTGSGNSVRLVTRSLANGSGAALTPVFPFFGSGFEMRPEKVAISTQGVIDIGLVIDRSGSMAYSSAEVATYPPAPAAAPPGWDFGDPVPPNARWLDLIAGVHTFTNELRSSTQEEFVSLTLYNHDATTVLNLSKDYNPIQTELVALSHHFDPGGTNIGSGMIKGMEAATNPTYARDFASKVVVLMTDGVHNYGTSPLKAANQLGNAGVTVFTITFSNEADQSQMQEVAQRTGGKHFHAITAVQLQNAFREIARSLPTLITK